MGIEVERADADTVRLSIPVDSVAFVGITWAEVVVRLDVELALQLANELAGACWDVAVASAG